MSAYDRKAEDQNFREMLFGVPLLVCRRIQEAHQQHNGLKRREIPLNKTKRCQENAQLL